MQHHVFPHIPGIIIPSYVVCIVIPSHVHVVSSRLNALRNTMLSTCIPSPPMHHLWVGTLRACICYDTNMEC